MDPTSGHRNHRPAFAEVFSEESMHTVERAYVIRKTGDAEMVGGIAIIPWGGDYLQLPGNIWEIKNAR